MPRISAGGGEEIKKKERKNKAESKRKKPNERANKRTRDNQLTSKLEQAPPTPAR
jgi:hypothetical protein